MKRRRWAALAVFVCVLAGMWGDSGHYAAHPPRLSSMSEARCMEILEAYGVNLPDNCQGMTDLVKRVEFNPYYYLGSTVGEAPNLLKECSDAVCAYYGWTLPPEKPRFSSLSEEECIKILTEYGVELPTDREIDIQGAVELAETRPFCYHAVSYDVAAIFAKQMSRAVSRYYGWFWDYDDGMGWVDEV